MKLKNRYSLLKLIQNNDSVDSWLAFDEQNGTKVFVKGGPLASVIGEAERLAKLNHPQIPKLLDVIEHDDSNYLIAQWIEGHTLGRESMRFGVFDQFKLRCFLREMLGILNHIHQKGIIHGDLTPKNILYRHSDKSPFLVDFGDMEGKKSIPYTSPEVMNGIFCEASDIYSLGVNAMVLLCGNYQAGPLEFFNPDTLRWEWRDYLFPDNVLGEFEGKILDRMIALRLEDRYQSVDEVLTDFGFYSLRSR